MGKLIVIDGLDGCGKSTQTQRVYEILKKNNDKTMMISYPNYDSKSSALVKMYLNGDFSKNANDVNSYAASSFYAVDRYAGYVNDWKEYYDKGYNIIASRYVSSNAIHQMGKLKDSEWKSFLEWLHDYEYNKLGLPKPDKIIYLDMDRDVADNLIKQRYLGDNNKKDIHEKNSKYLKQCHKSAFFAANLENWDIISCSTGNLPDDIDIITNKIIQLIKI